MHEGFSADDAAFYAGMLFIGITFGRFISGFMTIRFDDIAMIRIGQALTPVHFGEEHSGTVMGVQMASAYIGTCVIPPLFGVIANSLNISIVPIYIAVIIITQVVMHELLLKSTK